MKSMSFVLNAALVFVGLGSAFLCYQTYSDWVRKKVELQNQASGLDADIKNFEARIKAGNEAKQAFENLKTQMDVIETKLQEVKNRFPQEVSPPDVIRELVLLGKEAKVSVGKIDVPTQEEDFGTHQVLNFSYECHGTFAQVLRFMEALEKRSKPMGVSSLSMKVVNEGIVPKLHTTMMVSVFKAPKVVTP